MKDFIIAFFIVLALTCFFNDVGAVPVALCASVANVAQTVCGASRKTILIPEINVADSACNAPHIIGVEDTANRKSSHSQMGNNF